MICLFPLASTVCSRAARPDTSHGVLYCFLPCAYSLDLLCHEGPDLGNEEKDEFLGILVSENPSQLRKRNELYKKSRQRSILSF